jgi:uncharacterized protein YecE (DUF72 family)
MATRPKAWIGTSGYDYPEWRGPFYPPELPAARIFEHYRRSFDTVEINSTFYHFPRASTIEMWRERAGPGFLYAVKAWRTITHTRRIGRCGRELRDFFRRIERLGETLGPVLFQLPPRFRVDRPRLRRFLRRLPADFRCALEFRDPSWLHPGVYDDLRSAGVAACRVSSPDLDGPRDVLTAPFAYWRLHGARSWYEGAYAARELDGLADEVRRARREAFVYFDNTADGAAIEDARSLRVRLKLLRRRA